MARICLTLSMLLFGWQTVSAEEVPQQLQRWLEQQNWQRDVEEPVVALGPQGAFDDQHLFAPCVALEKGVFSLWYCGSRGNVAERVFDMGLATSINGRTFKKYKDNPVYQFGDGKHSILTPTLLRSADGSVLREQGKLRMWFSSTHFSGKSGLHTLHETSSTDGIRWAAPSESQLENIYSPTIIKDGDLYRMWYIDVSLARWAVRHAQSADGISWRVTEQPVLKVDQKWESGRLFYPTVLKIDGVYLMWYGSYWTAHNSKTALGLAASTDGIHWHKNSHNPVVRPDPTRSWESHYTTSQSVMRLADGTWRIWYASRKKPPFLNKYFAIGTAKWNGPKPTEEPEKKDQQEQANEEPKPTRVESRPPMPDPQDRAALTLWQEETRSALTDMLGIPKTRMNLQPEPRGVLKRDGIVLEKWLLTSEKGSRIPAILYRPEQPQGKLPAVVLTFGHGGCKSHPCYQYMAQLFAKLGFACLAMDPIGEEERHIQGRMGTRAHDPEKVHLAAWNAGRSIMGKLVFDTMRGVDYLVTRDDIDPGRIGVAGNSLGGAKAGWMAALDTRLKFCIVSGWAFDDITLDTKFCTKVPNRHMREMISWDEYLTLASPHCALLVINGDADVIIDRKGDGSAWRGTQASVDMVSKTYTALGAEGNIQTWFERGGGHRPYPAHPQGVEWLIRHGSPANWSVEKVGVLPKINFGVWAENHGIRFERLYGTPLHLRGATVVDLKIKPYRPTELAVLKSSERGRPEFTLKGWLARLGSH